MAGGARLRKAAGPGGRRKSTPQRMRLAARSRGAYAAVLAKHDRAEPFGDPERRTAARRGPRAGVARQMCRVEEFELIYTEGDSNNTRSIRVRYNAMLAQAAYDGAAPRAMAVEDVPNPCRDTCFIRGNPNNPGACARRIFFLPRRRAKKIFPRRQRPARTGAGHHRSGQSAHRPRDRQPRLDASFRLRTGPHAERFRLSRRSADASGIARLSRRQIRRIRLVAEEAAPPDHDCRPHTGRRARQRGGAQDRSGESAAVANEPAPAGDRKPARFDARRRRPARSHCRRRPVLAHGAAFRAAAFRVRLHRARARAGLAERFRFRLAGSARAACASSRPCRSRRSFSSTARSSRSRPRIWQRARSRREPTDSAEKIESTVPLGLRPRAGTAGTGRRACDSSRSQDSGTQTDRRPVSPWQYGIGDFDAADGRVTILHAFLRPSYRTAGRARHRCLPAHGFGKAVLHADRRRPGRAAEPGRDPALDESRVRKI